MLRSLVVLFVCCVGCSVTRDLLYDFDLSNFKQECGPNEVPMGCIDPCPREKTCQDREEYYCLGVYVSCQFQCHCKEGYIRKTEGGECVPIEECGVYCDRNQVYTDCKPSCQKAQCFATKKNSSDCVNEEPCKPGCFCKEGYEEVEENSTCLPRCLCPEFHDTEECATWKNEYSSI